MMMMNVVLGRPPIFSLLLDDFAAATDADALWDEALVETTDGTTLVWVIYSMEGGSDDVGVALDIGEEVVGTALLDVEPELELEGITELNPTFTPRSPSFVEEVVPGVLEVNDEEGEDEGTRAGGVVPGVEVGMTLEVEGVLMTTAVEVCVRAASEASKAEIEASVSFGITAPARSARERY